MKDREVRPEESGLIEGRNAVREALRAGTAIDKLDAARAEMAAQIAEKEAKLQAELQA